MTAPFMISWGAHCIAQTTQLTSSVNTVRIWAGPFFSISSSGALEMRSQSESESLMMAS